MLSGEGQGLRGPELAADTWLLVLHPRLASTRSLERFRNQVRFLSAQTYQGLSLPCYKTLKIHHRAPIKQVSPCVLILCPAAVGLWQCWLQMTTHAPGPRRFPLADKSHWDEHCVAWLGGDAALDGGQFWLGGSHVRGPPPALGLQPQGAPAAAFPACQARTGGRELAPSVWRWPMHRTAPQLMSMVHPPSLAFVMQDAAVAVTEYDV